MQTNPTPCSTSRSGFTLLELAVTVIIIAVLAVVALPMYQRAILKSKYSALLPVAQHLKLAQEAYYTGHSYYSDDLRTLDLDTPGTIQNATTTQYGDNMRAQISPNVDDEEEYSYVLTSKEGLNNNYIMYQEHSKNYPGEIHCEAKEGDNNAQWLCSKALHGTLIEKGSITPGYTTYILSGTGKGTFGKECLEEKELEDTDCECGKKTRESTGCNEDTGEWEYTEWSSCPVKPSEEENCDNGFNAKMTRTSTCEGGTWTEPAWDKSACCDPANKPNNTRSCKDNYNADTCGLEVQKYTCNSNGEWEALDEWDHSACTTAPDTEPVACDGNFTHGTMTSSYSCENDEWTSTYDRTGCGYECTGTKPDTSRSCPSGNYYCGGQTKTVECNYSTGKWVAGNWTGKCDLKAATVQKGKTGNCYKQNRTATCNGTSWAYGDWITSSTVGKNGDTLTDSHYTTLRSTQCTSGFAIAQYMERCTCANKVWTNCSVSYIGQKCLTNEEACMFGLKTEGCD